MNKPRSSLGVMRLLGRRSGMMVSSCSSSSSSSSWSSSLSSCVSWGFCGWRWEVEGVVDFDLEIDFESDFDFEFERAFEWA